MFVACGSNIYDGLSIEVWRKRRHGGHVHNRGIKQLMLYLLEQWAGQQTGTAKVECSETWGDGIRGVTGCLGCGTDQVPVANSAGIPGPCRTANRPLQTGRGRNGGPETFRGREERQRREGGRR